MTNDLVFAARGQIADFDRLIEAVQDVRTRIAGLLDSPDDDTVAAGVAQAAAAAVIVHGDPVPEAEAIGRRVLDARREAQERHAARLALQRVEEHLCTRLRRTVADGADVALDHLRAVHDQIIGQTTTVLAALDGVGNAEGAIVAGRADEWRRLVELAEEYADLRHAQGQVVTDALALPSEHGRFDPDKMAISDRARRLVTEHGVVRNPPNDQPGGPDLGAGWTGQQPTDRARRPWDTDDPVANLRAAVRYGSWMPSLGELHAARRAAAERAASKIPQPAGTTPLVAREMRWIGSMPT